MRIAVICLGCLIAVSPLQTLYGDQPQEGELKRFAERIADKKELALKLAAQIETLEQQLDAMQRAVRPAKPQNKLYAVPYGVSDLLPPAEPGVERHGGLDAIAQRFETEIAPASWKNAGGRGMAAPYRDNLSVVVSQTTDVHEKITAWLKKVRESKEVLDEVRRASFEHAEPGN